MEKTVPKDLFERRLGGFLQYLFGVVAGGHDGVAFIQWHAGQTLRGQHPPAGALPIDLGHAKIIVVLEVVFKLAGSRGLETEVHFQLHRLGQRIDGLHRFQAFEVWLGHDDQACDPAHQFQIALERRLDAGPQNLDGDVLTIGGDGEVDLGDRGGGDGCLVKGRKQLVQRTPEFAFDDGARLRGRERRQFVL